MKCSTHFMFLSYPIVNLVDSHLSILLGIRSDILDKHETIFAFLFNCLNSSRSNTGQIFGLCCYYSDSEQHTQESLLNLQNISSLMSALCSVKDIKYYLMDFVCKGGVWGGCV